ncbi:hypothetical protein C8Q76DRAFT_646575 [Earliella scabrosa]|nr:hypothetical protein C8Q76DRAFT_646575 [Earliella scabrosa]
MMRGATDLRNARHEVEEQRREIVFLQEQIESGRKEKEELAQRLQAVKEAAKQSLQSSTKSLEALRTAVSELKAQSEASFSVATDMRGSLADVQELRGAVSEAMKSIEPYLEPNDKWAKSAEARELLNTLELECSKSQQVADLLRDRLHSVGGELADSKSRITELEIAQGEDLTALSKANATILSTTKEVASLAECLKQQRSELHDALVTSADLEAKSASMSERAATLQQLVSERDAELESLKVVQAENGRLRETITDQDACIASLRELETEITRFRATICEREARIAELAAFNSMKDTQILECNRRLQQLQSELVEANRIIQQVKNDLGTSEIRGQTACKDNERLLNDLDVLRAQVAELEITVKEARTELDARSEKQVRVLSTTLEERFEDQSVTLRLTRESVGDAQERLLAAEASHAKLLAEATAKLDREIAVLQAQKLSLEATMEMMQEGLKRQEASTMAMQEEHKDRLKQQDSSFAARLESEEQRFKQLAADLEDARAQSNSLHDRNKVLEDDIRDLRKQLQIAQLPSPETETELRTLRTRVAALEAAEMKSTLRAKTIDARYRIGDLNDEEKAFINTLIQTSQAIHEQELVANRNELRRASRDNALKEMRSKVHLLESTLAKHLNAQKVKPVYATVDNQSMIDPAAWMSQSGQSSSPVQAPDRDGTASTNVDITVSARPTPAPNRVHLPPSTTHVVTAQVTPARHAVARLLHKTPPVGSANKQPVKPNFSRLATDCSDEILDFEDDENGGRKSSPTSSLGKRTKPASPPVDQGAPKPFKRLASELKCLVFTTPHSSIEAVHDAQDGRGGQCSRWGTKEDSAG